MSEQRAILLDTDLGSDIDDAVALAYLLRQRRCALAGITTVTGVPWQRAALAEAICQAAGHPTVAIHCGAAKALPPGRGQDVVHQFAALAHRPHRRNWPGNSAVAFLREQIRARPGELTLLAIGPLTNVALLFALDPEIPSLLRELVCMAGMFAPGPGRKAEYNVVLDPVAAQVVMEASTPRTVLVGLDVTTQCKMPAAEVRQRFTASPLDEVARQAEVWFTGQHQPEITFHDPLAAAWCFAPELLKLSRGRVQVELKDGATFGQTVFVADDAGPHEVALEVDVKGFFREYFGVFG